METMKQNRPELPVRLVDCIGSTQAWGTQLGAQVFALLNLKLMGFDEGTVVLLDFGGLERSDVSFQREGVVETVRKHRPQLLFVVVNIKDEDLRANLEMALEKRGESLLERCLSEAATPKWRVLGKKLSDDQHRTLKMAWRRGELTSAMLAQHETDGKLSTAASRLAGLWKAGLLARVEGTAVSGGREHRYYPVE